MTSPSQPMDWRNLRLAPALTIAVAGSILLSLAAVMLQDNLNQDGVKFIDAAVRFQQEGIVGAIDVYRWPAYSVIIGCLAGISGLSPAVAAHVFDAILLCLLSVSFVMLCSEVYPDRNVRLGALISIFALPAINEYRDYIIRDLANWSLIIFSCWQLLRFQRTDSWSSATLHQLGLIAAFMFKMEALAFALLAPAYFMLSGDPWLQRLKRAFKVSWLAFVALAIILVISTQTAGVADVTRLREAIRYLSIENVFPLYEGTIAALKTQVLSEYARSDAAVMWLSALFGLFVATVVSKLGFAHFGALALASAYRTWPRGPQMRLIAWLCGIAALILCGFLLQRFYLTGRYVAILAILLSVVAAGSIQSLLIDRSPNPPAWIKFTLGITLLYVLLDPFVQTSPRKTYLREAGSWTKEHVPGDARIFSNYPLLYFYSGRTAFRHEGDIKHFDLNAALERLGHYDYLLIREGDLEEAQLETLTRDPRLSLVHRTSKENDENGVAIYAVR